MAVTYAQAEFALREVSDRIVSNRKRLDNAEATIAAAEADLASMPAAYSAVINAVDAAVAASPTDIAYVNLKAGKDKLVAEFLALKAEATAMKNALVGV